MAAAARPKFMITDILRTNDSNKSLLSGGADNAPTSALDELDQLGRGTRHSDEPDYDNDDVSHDDDEDMDYNSE